MPDRRSRRVPSRRWIVAPLALMVIACVTAPAWAWGRLGHRVIAKLADQQLTPRAKAAIAALLEPGESLADASTWADEHRREIPGSAIWHFTTIPIDQDNYDVLIADERRGCIVHKFREFRSILADPSRSVEERRLALRFVVHLAGDVHQPLYVGDAGDRGGSRTQVRFYNRGSNLHRVWDSDLIERASRSEGRWVAELLELDTPAHRAATLRGSIEHWATESLRAARQAYRDPITGGRIRPGTRLGDACFEANLPIARRRLYQAGIRLATVLNDAFEER